MSAFRLVLAISAASSLAACPAKLRINVENITPVEIVILYGTQPVVVAAGKSEDFLAYVGSQHFQVVAKTTCLDYGYPLSSISGDFFRPGIRQTVSLTIDEYFALSIKPHKNNNVSRIVIKGTLCDQASKQDAAVPASGRKQKIRSNSVS